MIIHLVLFQPRADLSAPERRNLVDALTRAILEIPSIRRARVGRRVRHGRPYELLMRINYEYAAVLEFDDTDGLKAYLEHPAHEALASRFFDAFQEALMYDYELNEGAGAITGLL